MDLHLWHWAASGGALGSQLRPLSPRRLAWQAWRLATETLTLRGRHGAWRQGPSLCVAGVARRGTSRHGPSLCVAGVAQTFTVWQAWHFGRPGTYGTGLPLVARFVLVDALVAAAVGLAGMALGDIDLHFVWHAGHLATETFTLLLRGRHGASRHGPSLCVASVALMALGCLWCRAWFRLDAVVAAAVAVAGVALGRRCASRHGHSLCVAGVALMALGCLWWRAWFPFVAWQTGTC